MSQTLLEVREAMSDIEQEVVHQIEPVEEVSTSIKYMICCKGH